MFNLNPLSSGCIWLKFIADNPPTVIVSRNSPFAPSNRRPNSLSSRAASISVQPTLVRHVGVCWSVKGQSTASLHLSLRYKLGIITSSEEAVLNLPAYVCFGTELIFAVQGRKSDCDFIVISQKWVCRCSGAPESTCAWPRLYSPYPNSSGLPKCLPGALKPRGVKSVLSTW
jgi:hypothetical protein